jgi:hypothetical protein
MVILAAQARTGDYAAAVNADALMPFYAAATAALVALILYSVYAKREESAWR